MLGRRYDPNAYWLKSGKTYRDKFPYDQGFMLQESILINFLKSLQFSSVMEVGCGFGRITKLILENFPSITRYLAIDISPDQIAHGSSNIIGHDERLQYEVIDFRNFNAEAERFDLVLAVEVLMHIPPNEIGIFISKMHDLSNHHVVNIDWYEEQPQQQLEQQNNIKPETFCFIHQYPYTKQIPVRNNSLVVKQCLFYYDKNS